MLSSHRAALLWGREGWVERSPQVCSVVRGGTGRDSSHQMGRRMRCSRDSALGCLDPCSGSQFSLEPSAQLCVVQQSVPCGSEGWDPAEPSSQHEEGAKATSETSISHDFVTFCGCHGSLFGFVAEKCNFHCSSCLTCETGGFCFWFSPVLALILSRVRPKS